MIKKIMIPLMGLSMIGFVGCTDIQIPESNGSGYQAPANPTPTHARNKHKMVEYCKGMIAGEVQTKPMYVKMEHQIIRHTISGTAYGKRYTCQFDKNNNYQNVYVN